MLTQLLLKVTFDTWPGEKPGDVDGDSHVMTEASAMNACAVASFLIHLTATLVPL